MINKLRALLDAAKADVSYEILNYMPELLAVVEAAQTAKEHAVDFAGPCFSTKDMRAICKALAALEKKLEQV